jgi:predicted component of type VI protein secretion system
MVWRQRPSGVDSGVLKVTEWRLQFRGTLFPVRGGELTLGRSGYASIVVNNPLTSREHALVRLTGGLLELVDLGSKNGTYVNGSRISGTVPLAAGDRVKVGTDLIEVLRASAQDPTQLRAPTQPGRTRLEEGETDTTIHHQRSLDLAEKLMESAQSPGEHPAIARSLVEILNDFLLDTPVHAIQPGDVGRLRGLIAAMGTWNLGGEIDEWRRSVTARLDAPRVR